MAELTGGESVSITAPPISATTQILAVVWLRWRIFVNSTFRRRPKTAGQAVGFVFTILLRVIVWPMMAMMLIGPVLGCGFWAWETMSNRHPEGLLALFATVTVGWQFVAVNGLSVAAAVSTFDPASLIRYPLRFGRYFVLRTLIGFMTPSTVIGCCSLLAVAVGIGIARPSLIIPSLIVVAVYAMMNMFLTRMIGAWMERWLANRHFREFFGVFMALFAVGIQFFNLQRYPSHSHGMPHGWIYNFVRGSDSSLQWLPPGFATNAILHVSHPLSAFISLVWLIATTCLFAAVFAIRLRKQFQGEYLSDGMSRRGPAKRIVRAKEPIPLAPPAASVAAVPDRPTFPPIVAACLRKEWLIFRGNSAQFIGLLTPLIFIILLNRGQFATHPALFLPGAIAYALLGTLASLYNVFGADGLGVQIYLLAPIRMRDVIVAKNIASLVLVVAEAVLAWCLVLWLKRSAIPLATQVSTVFWTIFVIAVNVALGTLRSIQAPRKFVPGQTRQRRGIPTNRTSGLLVLFVLFGSLLLQLPAVLLSRHLHLPWLAAWIFGPLAVAAVTSYAILLRNAERLMLAHRDILAEELCKA
jgi:ABC-2 type transport system permease protein